MQNQLLEKQYLGIANTIKDEVNTLVTTLLTTLVKTSNPTEFSIGAIWTSEYKQPIYKHCHNFKPHS